MWSTLVLDQCIRDLLLQHSNKHGQLLSNMGVFLKEPPIFCCDNLHVVCMAANLVCYGQTKYIKIDYHLVQEHMTCNGLLYFGSSVDQSEGIMTRGSITTKFQILQVKLYIVDWTFHLRGSKSKYSCDWSLLSTKKKKHTYCIYH